MNKEQVKEVVKEMFKNGDIKICIENRGDRYEKTVTTTVEIFVNGEFVASDSDIAYLNE